MSCSRPTGSHAHVPFHVQRECSAVLDSERRRIGDELTREANAQLRAAQQELLARVGEETARRAAGLAAVRTAAEAADQWLSEREAYERRSRHVHKITLCALALLQRVQRGGGPLTQEAAALQVAADGDAVVQRALDMIPGVAHSAAGVPTLQELRERWVFVARAARHAALTPPSSGVLGQAVGAATSALLLPPPAPVSESGTVAPETGSDASSSALSPPGVKPAGLVELLLPAWLLRQLPTALSQAATEAGGIIHAGTTLGGGDGIIDQVGAA
jgi:hypothetical protein